jgi:hypothetical protein
MVAVPNQVLLPAWLGLGGGLPRAVPQDAVVALLDNVLGGSLLQHLILLLTLTSAGAGAARLVWSSGPTVGMVASAAYVWSAYVAERLLIGHWGLLVAYAALPWALAAAVRVRRGEARAWAGLVPLLALAALTPTGGLLVGLVCVPVATAGGRAAPRVRVAVVGAAIVANLPWLLPSLLNPARGASDVLGASVFALRPEGPHGALLTALGTGGIWNSAVVPASRWTLLAPLGTVVLLVLAGLGARAAVVVLGRAASWTLAATSAAGLAWSVLGAWSVTAAGPAWIVAHVPGAGLLRDAQKLLAPWSLLLAVCVALGVARTATVLARRSRESYVRPVVTVGSALMVVLLLPDLVWGAVGRLQPTTYPPGWDTVRAAVHSDPRTGDVLVLPWSAYRVFPWNAGTPVLDPAPRYLTRTTVVDDSLTVESGDRLLTVSGDDPRSNRVRTALAAGTLDLGTLRELGIGLVLVEDDQRGATASVAGLEPLVPPGATGAARLSLYAVPGGADPSPWRAPPAAAVAVVTVDALALLLVLICLGVLLADVGFRRASLLSSATPATRE